MASHATGSRRSGLRRRFNSAEAVADELRDRILSGEVTDGELLPKQEDLTEEFGVSKAAVREASRILETEGLLSVQRGNVGGAVVHVPTPTNVAYTLGLVLQGRGVRLGDVRATITELEPVCAALCAARPDRSSAVLPRLRAAQDQLERSLAADDAHAAADAARSWHEAMAQTAGLGTMAILVGALEDVWSSHVRTSARAQGTGLALDAELSSAVVEEHAEIQARIEAGDSAGAAAAARAHHEHARLSARGAYELPEGVSAAVVRDQLFG